MNNLDLEVAEAPEKLVVYGGVGKGRGQLGLYCAIVRELERSGNEETLLVHRKYATGLPDNPLDEGR